MSDQLQLRNTDFYNAVPGLHYSHRAPDFRKSPTFFPEDTAYKRKFFQKGEVLFNEGQDLENIYWICDGYTKVTTKNLEQEDVLLTVQGPGESLGEFAVYNDNKYPITAVAISAVSTIVVSADEYRRICRKHPEIVTRCMEFLFRRHQRFKRRLTQIGSQSMHERLEEFFTDLIKEFGVKRANGVTEIPFYLSRKELGQAIYCTQETATRIMNAWQKEDKVMSDGSSFSFTKNFGLLNPL